MYEDTRKEEKQYDLIAKAYFLMVVLSDYIYFKCIERRNNVFGKARYYIEFYRNNYGKAG